MHIIGLNRTDSCGFVFFFDCSFVAAAFVILDNKALMAGCKGKQQQHSQPLLAYKMLKGYHHIKTVYNNVFR